ncbi:hypothetical protein AmaxDRAFT_4327 [Limnospira maxima CS-328]|uniref:Uncharacterized protein n=2 Tax=Limnospira TaxID=2596745 RepID=A0A9P1P2I5_9CYAN|nr:hypothetical protein AmaxDRAFT_4327 [Limnospira maxima CS-328]CDM97549.1 conserved protein of unknown function [Limnospira indica PCC 8005]
MFQRLDLHQARQETQGQSHFKKSQFTVQVYLGGVLNPLGAIMGKSNGDSHPQFQKSQLWD